MTWETSLRRGSFRGVPFFMESEAPQGGRRVAVHDIAYGENAITEDFGRKTPNYSLTVYTTGADRFAASALALSGALDAPGAATIVMPVMGAQLVRCLTWGFNVDKRRLGYVGFDIECVPAGVPSVPFAPALGFSGVEAVFKTGALQLAIAVREIATR
ncbi:DNA circularization N-terminal domain-containing protein [Ahrensia sp. R2A130]|uniref:DNA circularization N-terminal domain-containing protein n=1 Tax=Ahrensia sp. R2A130 TaxID=744979 RepID=UPI0001E0B507|nr:DNA circularization N-terminal domain-containing protein [Ahrensia sp. R2A130]EFL88277.1 tail/DNA circulation protein [Ahrensia sp. R2A130]